MAAWWMALPVPARVAVATATIATLVVTVAAIPVTRKEATAFGVIESDAEGVVKAFHEKVADPPAMPGRPDMALASMGNYVFTTSSLLDALERDAALETSMHDFGRDIIPTMVNRGKPIILQPNAGYPRVVDGRRIYLASPETFGVCARRAGMSARSSTKSASSSGCSKPKPARPSRRRRSVV